MKTAAITIATLAMLALVCNPGGAQKIKVEDKDARKKATAEFIKRMDESTSLRWNASQMQTWSLYEGDDVLLALLDIYKKPPGKFIDNMRYLAAAYIRSRHDVATGQIAALRVPATASDIKHLRQFLKDTRKNAADVWGVYCAARILALEDDVDVGIELLDIVGDKRAPAVNRAAVVSALAHAGFEYMRRALEVMLAEDFKKTAEGAVMFEAICWAAARAYRPLHKEKQPVATEWRGVFDSIVNLLEDEKALLGRSQREAFLSLQFCFNTKHPYQFAMMWRQVLDSGVDPLGEGRTFAEFMGLDVMGDRVVFLIDASDSMLNPLGEKELEDIKGPVTGDKKKKGDGYEIDWSRVKNRFDVAREHVKWTLSRLGKDRQVCVILFGDKAEPLSVTDGFVASSNSRKIGAALDAIKPRAAPEDMKNARPYGTLMGETNYYSALIAAFRMGKDGGTSEAREHWDSKLITEGADAIFLLSDGVPIRDGFKGDSPTIDYEYEGYTYHDEKQPGEGEWVEIPGRPAVPESEGAVRDPETGAITRVKIPPQPAIPPRTMWKKKEAFRVEFGEHDDNGPYASLNSFAFASSPELNNLLDEIERMNLVRRCRIHCIGIGEAQMGWLKPIAKKGGGKAVYFGKDGERETKDDDRDFPGFPDMPEDD